MKTKATKITSNAAIPKKLTPCLWYDGNAEEAVAFYRSIFKKTKLLSVTRYSDAGPGKPGSVMTMKFRLEGQDFLALNGGPHYKLTPAISFIIDCVDQAEVDYFWDKLSEGGEIQHCGWLTDKFGLCWQVVPRGLIELYETKDAAKVKRVMEAMMKMVKLDIAVLEAAAKGETKSKKTVKKA
jgi:predicted 3-demethylubiquinone-9 3-methyltransferase (glyoxalase superfamily)